MKKKTHAFTLIELMIVVAIIGILAALGISNFRNFQMRSKLVEARGSLKGIATAESSYFAEQGRYLAIVPTPAAAPGAQPRAWVGAGTVGFNTIGFIPEGALRFQYSVDTNGASTNFIAAAIGDLDVDGVFSDFAYVHPLPGAAFGPASTMAAACIGGGVNDPSTPVGLFDTVGPCAFADGRSEF